MVVARALSRDEQSVLMLLRRTGESVPIPDLAVRLGLAPAAVQTACEYLISRGLLQATVYAVAAPATPKRPSSAAPAAADSTRPLRDRKTHNGAIAE